MADPILHPDILKNFPHEPDEEVGPGGCDASRAEVQIVSPATLEIDRHAAEPSPPDEMQDAFVPQYEALALSPLDGLPVPVGESNEPADAPELTHDSFVCMEDDREWVEVIPIPYKARPSRVPFRFSPNRVVLRKPGRNGVQLNAGEIEQLSEIERKERDVYDFWVAVRPRRERCKYYKRQIFRDGTIWETYRNCTERRAVGGAFLSLKDQAIYACDYRDPPDPRSVEKYLDAFDRKIVRRLPLVPDAGDSK